MLGAGVVPLASGPLGQTSRFSLELQLLLMLAAVGGGLLASPRADLLGEWRDLLSGLQPVDLLLSMVRAALFLAAICAWTRWRSGDSTRSDPRSDHGLTLFPSNLLVEGLMVLMTLKLAWIMAPPDANELAGVRNGPLLFVGSGLLLLAVLLVGLVREQGWGQRHLNLQLLIENASGVRVGQDEPSI